MNRVLAKLAIPGALALILVAIGGGAMLGAQSYAEELRAKRQATASQRVAAEQRLARVQHEATEIDLRVAQYLTLVRRGVLAEENRLDWIEDLNRAKTLAGLSDVNYAFTAQNALAGAGEIVTRSSLVTVEAKVIHEERLLQFLGALEREMSPHVSVRSCSMSRDKSALQQKGLTARCEVALITLSDPRKGQP